MEIRRDINQYAHVDLKHISAFTRDEIFYNLDVIFLLHMLDKFKYRKCTWIWTQLSLFTII